MFKPANQIIQECATCGTMARLNEDGWCENCNEYFEEEEQRQEDKYIEEEMEVMTL